MSRYEACQKQIEIILKPQEWGAKVCANLFLWAKFTRESSFGDGSIRWDANGPTNGA